MRQPDDPGPDDDLPPFDPDPMKGVRESPLIRAYVIGIILVIMATWIFWE